MGQYYKPVLETQSGAKIVYSRDLKTEDEGIVYMPAKLMEHSWWKNPLLNSICSVIYQKPHKILWVGDYSADGKLVNGLTREQLGEFSEIAWSIDGVFIEEQSFDLDGKFIVNHTKETYIDCDQYKKENDVDGWIVHPLSLLTCIGNGLGGGDYSGTNESLAGSWANDLISIEDNVPNNYCLSKFEFKE